MDYRIVHKLIKDVIQEIRDANQSGKTSHNKFLQTLLNQADLTEDEMIVIASTLLLDSLSTVCFSSVFEFFPYDFLNQFNFRRQIQF